MLRMNELSGCGEYVEDIYLHLAKKYFYAFLFCIDIM